ncbi:MAG TPA: hypothetical protein DCX53_01085 [Anaerolineae bacterium]|nr:hypothetical protein [Anaerolineae bacterium]
MNDQSTKSKMEDPDRPPPQGALPVWSRVYSKPSEDTFQAIIDHPDALAKNAYIWVFLAGMLSGLISSLTQFVVGVAGLHQVAPELGEIMPTGFLGGMGLVSAICGAPLAGLASVVGFAISTAIIHWAARFFGGQGSFDQLAYSMGAVVAPFSIVSALLVPFNAIPFLVYCTIPILLIGVVYVIYLEMAAIKAVYRFGWFESAGALFLPTILITCICALVVLGLMRVMGPSINEVFQQIQ